VFRQAEAQFTFEDATQASLQLSKKIAPAAEVAPLAIRKLIDLLVEQQYLQETNPSADQVVQLGQPSRSAAASYQVRRERLAELGKELRPVLPARSSERTYIGPPPARTTDKLQYVDRVSVGPPAPALDLKRLVKYPALES
jgi:hypothetical protein